MNGLTPQSKIYIELFIGSGASLLNRGRSETEVVNDFEPAVSNLYKVLSDKEMGKELLEKMLRLPYDEKLFHTACEYQRENFKGINDIEKALLTFVLISQSYNNTRKQFSRGTYDTQSYQRKIHSNLPKVYERLQGVQVYNKNALDIIKEAADNPNVQMYLDPPYLHSLRGEGADKVYFKEMEYIDHVRMLETIQNAKCRILLSGYHADKDDLYDKYLLPYGWKSRELIKIVKSSQRQEERDIASEWVWFNYDISDEGGDGVMKKEADKIPVWEKYTLTIAEASDYFNIGESKLRRFLSEHERESYILMNGTKVLIKRKQFEKVIDGLGSI